MTSPSPPAPSSGEDPPQRGAIAALILHHTVTVLLLVGALALGIWGYLTYRRGGLSMTAAVSAQAPPSQRHLIASQIARLELAAETSRQLYQSAPLKLEALIDQGLISRDDLSYPSSRVRYTLHVEGEALHVTAETLPPERLLNEAPLLSPAQD